MSETEHYVGKLIPVEMKGSLEDTARQILSEMGEEKKDYYESYLEQLEDDGYKQYIITSTDIYKVKMEEVDPDYDILRSNYNDNGVIDFEVRYYNGGCSFDEAVKKALKRIKNV